MELGKIHNMAHGARFLSPPHSEISKIRAKMMKEKAAAAVNKHSRRAELSLPKNDGETKGRFGMPTNNIENFCSSVVDRLKEYEQLVQAILDGRFSRENLKNWPNLEADKVLHLLRDS